MAPQIQEVTSAAQLQKMLESSMQVRTAPAEYPLLQQLMRPGYDL